MAQRSGREPSTKALGRSRRRSSSKQHHELPTESACPLGIWTFVNHHRRVPSAESMQTDEGGQTVRSIPCRFGRCGHSHPGAYASDAVPGLRQLGGQVVARGDYKLFALCRRSIGLVLPDHRTDVRQSGGGRIAQAPQAPGSGARARGSCSLGPGSGLGLRGCR
jgi:hypothetical protein